MLASPAGDPVYKVVTKFQPISKQGMPGPYPGQVIRVHSEKSIDAQADKVDREVVKQMLSTGIRALTGDARNEDAWARFITPQDVVGIKVNCSGAPGICSHPVVVAEIVRNLVSIDVKPKQIYIYERFRDQMDTVKYESYVPEGVTIVAAENSRSQIAGYDPRTYVEVDFFGEEDTRSNLVRLVS